MRRTADKLQGREKNLAGDGGAVLITKESVDSRFLEERRLAQKRSSPSQRERVVICVVEQFTAGDTDLIGIKNMSSTGKIIFM